MKRIYLSLVKLSLCFLIGCVAIPTSTEKNPTLLVGTIIFGGSDYMSSQGISFSGVTTSGIEISLRNAVTNERFRFSPGKNGLFYYNLQEGKYCIDELYIKKERNDGAWSYITTSPSKKLLEIERGKVNNLGTIHWSFVDRRHEVVQVDNSVDTKNEFAKQFPKSNWNTKEWTYNELSFDIKKGSDEKVTYYVKNENGLDSTLITMPKDTPAEIRSQIEKDIVKRMNDIRTQGDTTYYVKSENGLDSAFLKIPKAFSKEEKQRAEEHVRSLLHEKK